MATKQARGTKRTCQNEECGARFYDLGRKPIICPVCEEIYEIASSPLVLESTDDKTRPKPKKSEFAGEKVARTEDAEAAETEEALEDIEVSTEEIAAEEDETFLEEEEEEGGNLSTVIGGPVTEVDEEP